MDKVKESMDLLVQTRDTLMNLLKDNDMLRIRVKSNLDNLIGQFGFITGYRSSPVTPTQFPEQTEFMGVPLNSPEPVKTEDLTPKELERKLFKEKIDRLEEALPSLTNEAILEAYPNPSDKLVIRGLAKRAGLEDYKDGEVNQQFLENIRLGFKAQEEYETKVKKEVEALNKR